jgi:hypothetical protein
MTKLREIDAAKENLRSILHYDETMKGGLHAKLDALVEGRLTRDQIAGIADLVEAAFNLGIDVWSNPFIHMPRRHQPETPQPVLNPIDRISTPNAG